MFAIDTGLDELLRGWEAAARERRERRLAVRDARRRRRRIATGLAAIALAAIVVALRSDGVGGLGPPRATFSEAAVAIGRPAGPDTLTALTADSPTDAEADPRLPRPTALSRAASWAGRRDGVASFAVVDSEGELHGHEQRGRYVSASVVKALLLAAELRRIARADLPVDGGTEALLRDMITWSDNEAADAIYAKVGDAGLHDLARRAGMRRFTVAGHWSNAQVTAADLARFFSRLDSLLPGRHRELGLGLLGSVVPEQSWGIPAAAGDAWAVRFKGGWRDTELGQLAHQGAELRERSGDRELAVAVLTDGQPSQGYAIATVAGIAKRLLDR